MKSKFSNVIINGFHDSRFDSFLEEFVNRFNVKKCYYLCDDKKRTISNCITVLPDLQKMTFGIYDRAMDSLLPLDQELLSQLRECEILCLRMMDRLEYNCILSYKERKEIFLNHVRYWNTVLEQESISLFLANNMPHEIYDYIIYSLCRIKNIKTLFFHQSLTIPDSIFLIQNIKESTIDIKNEYKKLCLKNEKPVFEKTYSDYWKQQTDASSNPTPFYMKSENSKVKLFISKTSSIFLKILKSISSVTLLNKITFYSSTKYKKQKKRIRELKRKSILLDKEYSKYIIDEPDLNQKYIYVPLHYQPELTTCPLAEDFVDQLLLVHLISQSISPDTLIYVKEHPKQSALGRDDSFYSMLSQIKSVRLISKKFSSYELMNNSVAVATCTGTAGWEALFRQKPVLMFGNFFYKYADGVYRIRTIEDCRKACIEINKGKMPDLQKIEFFLQAVQNCTIRAVCDPVYWTISTISAEESNKNMVSALMKKLV